MYTNGFVDSLPLWALAVITAVIVFLSIEAGWQLGRYFLRRHKKADEKEPSISIAVGATLGLLSFLLAFTFGMAATRFDTRKGFVVAEVNGIGTAYLRTSFLPDPLLDEARQLLKDYLVIRSGGASSIMSTDGMARAASIQDRLWRIGTDAVQSHDTVATGLFIQSLNDMIDLDSSRVTGLRNILPDNIWLMLALVTIISMTSLGFEFGISGDRRWVAIILLSIAFTAVILLISDLDRPQQGLISVSQQPLLDLLTKISGAVK
jgi:hypothetical protein